MRHVVDVGAQAVEEVQHQGPLDALESHLGLASKDALVAEEVHREGGSLKISSLEVLVIDDDHLYEM